MSSCEVVARKALFELALRRLCRIDSSQPQPLANTIRFLNITYNQRSLLRLLRRLH
jgi:hypothetical protein